MSIKFSNWVYQNHLEGLLNRVLVATPERLVRGGLSWAPGICISNEFQVMLKQVIIPASHLDTKGCRREWSWLSSGPLLVMVSGGKLVWTVCFASILAFASTRCSGVLPTRDSFYAYLFACLLQSELERPMFMNSQSLWSLIQGEDKTGKFLCGLPLWTEFFSSPLSPLKLYIFKGSSFSWLACVC